MPDCAREIVRERMRTAIDEARRSNMEPAEIEAIFREEWVKASSQNDNKLDGDGRASGAGAGAAAS